MAGSMTWNLWQTEWLYSEAVDFDGTNRLIYVHPAITDLIIRSHVYSAWKRWVPLHKNSGYAQAMRVVGGDPVGAGQFAGDIYFLMNGWRIVIDHPVNIDGILYHDDAGLSPYKITGGGGVVARVSSLTQLVEVGGGGGGGATASQIWGTASSSLTAPGSVGALVRQVALDADATKTSVASARTEISSVNTKVAAVAVDIDAVQSALATVADNTDTVEATLVAMDGKLDTLGGNVEAIDGKMDSIVSGTEALQTDVTNVLGNLAEATSLINTLLKYERNRTKVDQAAKTLTVFDDDGITPLKVFNLLNFLGQPSVSEVAERSPS